MRQRMSLWHYVLLFLSSLSFALAASPTSFCKCTCFTTNSTIIPLSASLKPKPSEAEPPPEARTCADCNKQFCLSYNLPICQEAEEEDVLTTCFQRDSTKDQVVIYSFIGATVGLLGWAIVKPYWEKWRENGGYEAVSGDREGQ